MNPSRHLLAPYVQNFFAVRMRSEQNASPNSICGYRDAFRLLLNYTHEVLGISPNKLLIENLSADLISKFLTHLETDRGNSINTRNTRLTAIKSFFTYVSSREPDLLHTCQQILDIPSKKKVRKNIDFLHENEIKALLDAPKGRTWHSRRDQIILRTFIATGLRVSELRALKGKDLFVSASPYVSVIGKGRKERDTPLDNDTAKQLARWTTANKIKDENYIFTTIKKKMLSRDAIEKLVKKHVRIASSDCRTIGGKNITPHSLRHTTAMRLLQSGVHLSVIALWLGHESIRSTMVYVHADLKIKKAAMDRMGQIRIDTTNDSFVEDDDLLHYLENL